MGNKIQVQYVGKPDKIIEAACMTMGFPIEYIFKIIVDRSENFGGLNLIDVGDWCYLCKLLHLDIGCISYGYSTSLHKYRIGEAIYLGNYHLPITEEMKTIGKSFKIEMKLRRRHELKNYGGKLRRKIQLGYFKSDVCLFFSRLYKKLISLHLFRTQNSYSSI